MKIFELKEYGFLLKLLGKFKLSKVTFNTYSRLVRSNNGSAISKILWYFELLFAISVGVSFELLSLFGFKYGCIRRTCAKSESAPWAAAMWSGVWPLQ